MPDSQRDSDHRGEVVVVTGMTGAGRSTAAKELEDLGYFVVDNLPPALLRDVVRLVDESRGIEQPIAVVVDVRSGSFFDVAAGQPRTRGPPAGARTLLFLEADRRRAGAPPGGRPASAPAAGRRPAARRARSASARCWPTCAATPTWCSTPPTSTCTSCTDRSPSRFGTAGATRAQGDRDQLRLQVRHPGRRRLRRRHAVPAQPVLGPRAAAAAPAATRTVADYVLSQRRRGGVPRPLRAACSRPSPRATSREGKRFMTVAVGCTGGKHRSVAMTEEIAAPAARPRATTSAPTHRDLGRE